MAESDSIHPAPTAQHHGGHGHEPAAEPLGAVDVIAWAYALAGSLLGVLVVVALYIARGS